MDLISLLPEKFRDSEVLQDLLDVLTASFLKTQGQSIPVHSKTVFAVRASSEKICLLDSPILPKDRPVDLVLWTNQGGKFEYEIVSAMYAGIYDATSSVYSLVRGRLFTTPKEFAERTNVSVFISLSVEDILSKIDNLSKNLNPFFCPQEYLQELAYLIGSVLRSPENASASERRAELLMTIDWYKNKGTYNSIKALEALTNLRFKMFDMYTNDYTTFVNTEWFVQTLHGPKNPPGLSDDYYKSPHFGAYFWLDLVYLLGSYEYRLYPDHLWRPALFEEPNRKTILDYIERTRPVNTVPHLGLYLECHADESGEIFIDYDRNDQPLAASVVTNYWSYGTVIFDKDEDNNGVIDINFDEDVAPPSGEIDYEFDTSADQFFDSLTSFKVSTKPGFLALYDTEITLTDPVYTGSIQNKDKAIFEDRVEISIIIPKENVVVHNTPYGITKIGIYNSSGQLVELSTFPSIYKDGTLDLFVKIIVYRTKDPNKYRKKRIPLPEGLPDTIDIAVQCVGLCSDLNP